ncbi:MULTISPECIES: FAD-dependent oxidoreductase [unclassified Microbacterium]|uniref:protoporphyrinogen/coproporphyrinogen oxidase n=1 Tax=unclassified Microbacterium TaxID=2609290 RepID=UPI00214CF5B4|nr:MULTISPECIES: FAD-dependent oxidoreductase [unclassified Microbacterium]MCR2783324.1 FAD-dependent oxidoreductase [Microbacterium sp. zg.B96]WIM15803.1 FAD-dependent oxidoreductase [Microbacterium sp. zg-B96]
MSEVGDLVTHAHETRVVVIGGGIAGLVAALECAKVGMPVTLLEASDRLGGVVRSVELDGVTVDVGAESFAVRGGTVAALVAELGLSDAVVSPNPAGAWVAGLPGGGAAPMPVGGMLGIPANPFADDVRRVIGWPGAWRAYLDRLRPPMTIGHEKSLGALVRRRMGAAVLDRLVAPVTSGVYSARPDDIDVDLAAPGLNNALTRTGSLSGGVAQLRGAATTAPGSAVRGLAGGMTRLVDALRDRLVELGVDVRVNTPAQAIVADGDGWAVEIAAAPESGDPATDPSAPADPTEPAAPAPEATRLPAEAVIVATSEAQARHLLAPVVPDLDPGGITAPVVEIVTLVVDAPALDAHPRGTGVLTVPGSHTAKALTHSTAKWEWLRKATDHHIVRVSFGAQGEAPATEALDDDAAAALALAEAAKLLGTALDPSQLRAAHRERYVQSQPAAAIGRTAVTAAARAAVHATPGLAAVGAWLAGTGLAQVIPDAIAEAERVRREALWGDAAILD